MDRNADIVASLADALGKRLYEAHCEWTLAVFASGERGIVCADWYEMKPDEKANYVRLAEATIREDSLSQLMKRVDPHVHL